MNPCYAKTDAGRDEIRDRARKLTRAARNLLLIIDERHTGSNWVHLVHGASEADLRDLLNLRLIEQRHDVAPAFRLRSSHTMAEALAHLSYDQLYNLLTSQARDRLGLVRGLKFVLAIERCETVEQLRDLALEFMKLVHQHQGEAAARQMRLALGVA
jgi:hypothetical protein